MTRTNKGFVIKSGESRIGIQYVMKGVTLNAQDFKISSKDTGGEIFVLELIGYTPMGGPPLHIHPHQDEIIYVTEGEFQVQVGEDRFHLRPGDTAFMPRNIQHGFLQLNNKGRLMITFFPAGKMEDFFKTANSWTSPPTSEKEIAEFFAEHDLIVVGPPLKPDYNILNK